MGAIQRIAMSAMPAAFAKGLQLQSDRRIVPSLEQYLASRGLMKPDQTIRVLALKNRQETSLVDILIGQEILTPTQLAKAQAGRFQSKFVDLLRDPPNADLVNRFGAARCLRTGLVPWRMRNGFTMITTARPEDFTRHKKSLEDCFGPVVQAFACPDDLTTCITLLARKSLTKRAETRVPDMDSCRTLNYAKFRKIIYGTAAGLTTGMFVAPRLVFAVFCVWAIITLLMNTALKLAALTIYLRRGEKDRQAPAEPPILARLPKVSIMVPLFQEREIAGQLVTRLARLNYPKELLDILLVVEDDDDLTQDTLGRTDLPVWMRTISVPVGGLKTKPRALNYALDYCKGSIIGVYDAEDAPDPYQLKRVVQRFAERDEKVACLQGTLDFYNPRANWLARCFTVEYATWFRIVLPGLQQLGLPVPLGGTTLFFRRPALEKLGAWDAHNVTEDADLGIRLARHGYTTELISSVTLEEANCRAWPWVRQRSRWLKGYAVTWAVHMRNPKKLLADVGPWQFFGVQLLFAGTLSQFILAPILWTFWLAAFGLPHPLNAVLPNWGFLTLGAVFLFSELANIAIGGFAVARPKHRHLIKWVPTLHFYFPLGALAAYKGIGELFYRPFYWDKTSHGVSTAEGQPKKQPPNLQRPASTVSQKPRLGAVSQLHTQLLRRARKSP